MNTTKTALSRSRSRLSHVAGLALAIGLAASTGGCALSVEADIPEIEITRKGLVFPGVGIPLPGDVAASQTFSQDHSKLEFPDGLESEITTLGVTLRARDGIADFSFIRSMRIMMGSDDGSAAMEIGSYEQPAGGAPSRDLTFNSLNPVNVLDAWNTESAKFTLDVVGTLPISDWSMDVVIRFAGRARYAY